MLYGHNPDFPIFSPLDFDKDCYLITRNPPFISTLSMAPNVDGNTGQQSYSTITTVAQALEVARDSAEGASDPTVTRILEAAVTEIWGKIETQPTSYVMTRAEFAVFNYFQTRFEGQQIATDAKRRYWDHLSVTNGAD